MPELRSSPTAQEGDLAQFVDARNKEYIVRLTAGNKLQTHRGELLFDDLIGIPWGSMVTSHLGKEFTMVQPSLHDSLLNIQRMSTILYPKDMGWIMMNMNIVPGTHIIEAGTGSGAFTLFLATVVGERGHVYSYDLRDDMQGLAHKNLSNLGLADRVTLINQDIAYGFEQSGVDALFLDLPNPEDYLPQVRAALRSGGFFGSLLPTTNQISNLLEALYAHDFAFIEVCELMLRYYKAVPARLRPDDRMIAHTGYVIFGRPMVAGLKPRSGEE